MKDGVIVGAAIVRAGRLLAAQRSYPADLAGYWELPGGRVEAGESEAEALRRECVEELAVTVRVGERVGTDVALPGGKSLRVYAAELVEAGREPVAVEHKDLRWLAAAELDDLAWLPADRVLLPALRGLLATAPTRR